MESEPRLWSRLACARLGVGVPDLALRANPGMGGFLVEPQTCVILVSRKSGRAGRALAWCTKEMVGGSPKRALRGMFCAGGSMRRSGRPRGPCVDKTDQCGRVSSPWASTGPPRPRRWVSGRGWRRASRSRSTRRRGQLGTGGWGPGTGCRSSVAPCPSRLEPSASFHLTEAWVLRCRQFRTLRVHSRVSWLFGVGSLTPPCRR